MKTSELRSFVIDAINPIDNIQWRVAGRTPAGDFHWSEWRHFSVKRDHPLYVSPAGTGSGSSWTDAINLQDALGIAVYGDQLWVAAGTYKPTEGTDRTISFHLKDGVELYGGFAGNETELSQRNWRKNTTILSGDIGVAEDNTDNSYHVISVIATELSPISNPSIIDGFIIEDGYASLSSNSNNWGGGLYLSYASSLIRNTWFRNNYAVYDGGAVYAAHHQPYLQMCYLLIMNQGIMVELFIPTTLARNFTLVCFMVIMRVIGGQLFTAITAAQAPKL